MHILISWFSLSTLLSYVYSTSRFLILSVLLFEKIDFFSDLNHCTGCFCLKTILYINTILNSAKMVSQCDLIPEARHIKIEKSLKVLLFHQQIKRLTCCFYRSLSKQFYNGGVYEPRSQETWPAARAPSVVNYEPFQYLYSYQGRHIPL